MMLHISGANIDFNNSSSSAKRIEADKDDKRSGDPQ
jgi:hypothetical protein